MDCVVTHTARAGVGPAAPPQPLVISCRSVCMRLSGSTSPWGSVRPCCRGDDARRLSASTAGPQPTTAATGPQTNMCRPSGAASWHCGNPKRRAVVPGAAAASHEGPQDSASESTLQDSPSQSTYTLEDTRRLVETAMLAAVSGLAYLVSTILKLENSLGYFLPLPVVLAALRSGGAVGWRTMMATCFLLIVLLGPLRALSYFFLHGLLAATLGSLWRMRVNFWLSVVIGAAVRMVGQLSYLILSSVAMNENMFALVLSNIHNTLDQLTAALGMSGAPSPLVVQCMVFALLLVNGFTYCFLVHVVYRVVLGTMGFQLGPLPGLVNKWLRAGVVQPQQQ